MSRNIIIQIDGVDQSLSAVEDIQTDRASGGAVKWVIPEEKTLAEITATENKTYRASDAGTYGIGKVTVDVPVKYVTGKGEDGQTHHYGVDDEGHLTDQVLPESIAVITPPYNPYGIYNNGQTITKDGMVVMAYYSDGSEYGEVNIADVTISPTTAVYDEATDTAGRYESTLDGITVQYVDPNGFKYEGWYNIDYHEFGNCENAYIFINNGRLNSLCKSPYTIQARVYYNDGRGLTDWTNSNQVRIGDAYPYYTQSYSVKEDAIKRLPDNTELMQELGGIGVAQIIFEGDRRALPAGSHQIITVSWPRDVDGRVLETTFEVLVAPPYNQDDSSFPIGGDQDG